ncbi:MAG: iron-sulfur cluster assembly scaffold protein [Armatimonadota bacterium]
MYTDKVMDHFMNPRNMGEVENANAVSQVGNPVCGDVMRMTLHIDDDDRITDAKFKTFGCGAAIATSSIMTEIIKGKTIDEALQVTNKVVTDALGGLPAQKRHCSVLAEEGIHEALRAFFREHPDRSTPERLQVLDKAAKARPEDPHAVA